MKNILIRVIYMTNSCINWSAAMQFSCLCTFVDLTKAFDTVSRDCLWKIMNTFWLIGAKQGCESRRLGAMNFIQSAIEAFGVMFVCIVLHFICFPAEPVILHLAQLLQVCSSTVKAAFFISKRSHSGELYQGCASHLTEPVFSLSFSSNQSCCLLLAHTHVP